MLTSGSKLKFHNSFRSTVINLESQRSKLEKDSPSTMLESAQLIG